MKIRALAAFLVVAGCGGGGVGFGPVGYGGPGAAPQSTEARVSLAGLDPFPVYTYSTNGDNSPAAAAVVGGSVLRTASANLEVTVDGQAYRMRQVQLDDNVYVVGEGGQPGASMPAMIKARAGCLVEEPPLVSKQAFVYTLNCS